MMIQIYFILNIGLIILSVAQLVTTVIFFSALDKSRIKWDNSRNLNIISKIQNADFRQKMEAWILFMSVLVIV